MNGKGILRFNDMKYYLLGREIDAARNGFPGEIKAKGRMKGETPGKDVRA